MSNKYKLVVKYRNGDDSKLEFWAEGTLRWCCAECQNILCDEILSISMKKVKDKK